VRLRGSQDDRATGREHVVDVEPCRDALGQMSLPA
jgi:hypothetical protein